MKTSKQILEAEKTWNNLPSVRRAYFKKHQEIDQQIDDKEPLDRDEPDDHIAEHDNREYQIVAENQRHFEEDNPRE